MLIATWSDGRARIVIERGPAGEASVQCRHYLRGLFRQVEVIDADGRYFTGVRTELKGVDWRVYRAFRLAGLLVLPFDLLFFTVLVRVRILTSDVPPVVLGLQEIKDKATSVIENNPRAYTHAPASEIVGRIRKAGSVEAVINCIMRD